MMKNTYLYEDIMFTKKLNAASFEVGNEKIGSFNYKSQINTRVWGNLSSCILFKVGPSGPEKLELIVESVLKESALLCNEALHYKRFPLTVTITTAQVYRNAGPY